MDSDVVSTAAAEATAGLDVAVRLEDDEASTTTTSRRTTKKE